MLLSKLMAPQAYSEFCNSVITSLEFNDYGDANGRRIATETAEILADKFHLYFLLAVRLVLNDAR